MGVRAVVSCQFVLGRGRNLLRGWRPIHTVPCYDRGVDSDGNTPQLISTRRRAGAALLIALWFEGQHLYQFFAHRPRRALFDEAALTGDPVWLARTINLLLLGLILLFCWTLIFVLRRWRGAERICGTAWILTVLVTPVKDFVPASAVWALEGVQSIVWLIAICAAAYSYRKLPKRTKTA